MESEDGEIGHRPSDGTWWYSLDGEEWRGPHLTRAEAQAELERAKGH